MWDISEWGGSRRSLQRNRRQQTSARSVFKVDRRAAFMIRPPRPCTLTIPLHRHHPSQSAIIDDHDTTTSAHPSLAAGGGWGGRGTAGGSRTREKKSSSRGGYYLVVVRSCVVVVAAAIKNECDRIAEWHTMEMRKSYCDDR